MLNRVLLMSALLLLFAGCKDPPLQHAKDVLKPFVLLDPGDHPRARLRYDVPDGTVSRLVMQVDATTTGTLAASRYLLGLQSGTVEIIAGPTKTSGERIRFPVEIVKATPHGESPEDAAWAEALVGAGALIETDLRGNIVWDQTNARFAKLPPRTRVAMFLATFGVLRIVLPDAPVGVGARWETNRQAAVLGFRTFQHTTYTWVGRAGDALLFNLEYDELGEPQPVRFVDERAPIQSEALRVSGQGTIELRLDTPMSSATATGRAKETLAIETDGVSRDVEVDEAFEIRATQTSTNQNSRPTLN